MFDSKKILDALVQGAAQQGQGGLGGGLGGLLGSAMASSRAPRRAVGLVICSVAFLAASSAPVPLRRDRAVVLVASATFWAR
jgi:hypothetical protein